MHWSVHQQVVLERGGRGRRGGIGRRGRRGWSEVYRKGRNKSEVSKGRERGEKERGGGETGAR